MKSEGFKRKWGSRIGILLAVALFGVSGRMEHVSASEAGTPDYKQMAAPDSRGNVSLKEIYKDDFLLGNIYYNPWDTEKEKKDEVLKQHFNVLTPENIMKPDATQGTKGVFTFAEGDKMLNFCEANGMLTVGHAFAWNQQTPEWMTATGSREEAVNNLKTHIYEVASHYKGRIYSWDVVNEAIRDGAKLPENGDWKTCLKEDGWYAPLGPDFIEMAFRFAHEADPNAKLYYNDYNLDFSDKAEIAAAMFRDLRAKGVPVDGIGMQSHYDTNTKPENVERSIQLFRQAGAEVAVSELDIGVADAKGAAALTKEQEKIQAQLYAKLFQVYLRNKDVIERVTLWGITDNASWRKDLFPCVFNNDYTPKEAFYAVADPYGYLGEKQPEPKILADFNFDVAGNYFDGGNAKASGTYTLENHDSGKALKLDGNGQHLVVTDKVGGSLLTGVTEMTVSYQIKPENSATNWGFFAAPNTDEPRYQQERYLGIFDMSGTTRAERYNNSGARPETASCATGYNGWYHVSVVYTKYNTIIYINGVKAAEAASGYALTDILGDNSVLYIGKSTWAAGQEYATALLDNYKIVNKALTAEEVAAEAAKYAVKDKTALAEAIRTAVPAADQDKYTEDSWKVYADALAKANEVNADADALQKTIDEAAKALMDAQSGLKEKSGLPYVDIEGVPWAYDAIAYNYDAGIMTGKDETHFAPEESLKRAQFAAVLYKMNKSPAVEFEEAFPDVPAEAWCADCVTWALNHEIVTGYTDTNTFRPDNPVSRAELAAMLYRYAKNYKKYDVSAEGDYSTFPDADEVQEFAKEAISWAVGEGIITGKTVNGQLMLYPNGTANRAECAIIIQRYMELYE